MTGGVRLWEIPVAALAILTADGVVYLAVGYLAFYHRRARRLAVIGHH